MIRVILITLLFISCQGNTTQTALSYQNQVAQLQPDTLLAGIQDKIYRAFVQSLLTKDNGSLTELSAGLAQLYETRHHNLIQYWRAYLQFYLSIYYLNKGDKKTAEKEIDKGLNWLEEMKNKNSEDYALLSEMLGFSIQFKPLKAMFLGPEAQDYATLAIKLDSTNLRAYYVYASNDFYTPEAFGGGKEAEKYLLKALSLPAQKIANEYLPSWGREESYELLIKLYIKKEKWELAKKYFKQGIKEFPESYSINQLASKLIGK